MRSKHWREKRLTTTKDWTEERHNNCKGEHMSTQITWFRCWMQVLQWQVWEWLGKMFHDEKNEAIIDSSSFLVSRVLSAESIFYVHQLHKLTCEHFLDIINILLNNDWIHSLLVSGSPDYQAPPNWADQASPERYSTSLSLSLFYRPFRIQEVLWTSFE